MTATMTEEDREFELSSNLCSTAVWDRVVPFIDKIESESEGILRGNLHFETFVTMVQTLTHFGWSVDDLVEHVHIWAADVSDE